MSEAKRAAARFQRSMASAAAKSARPARQVSAVRSLVLCDECHIPIAPGQEVFSMESGFSDVRVICYECKAALDDADDLGE